MAQVSLYIFKNVESHNIRLAGVNNPHHTIKTRKWQNKNAIKGINLNQAAFQYFVRKDKTAAVNATAAKQAVSLWKMIVKKQPYNSPAHYLFLDQKRKWI